MTSAQTSAHNPSSRPIIAIGRSIGSIAAVELARQHPTELAGLVIESGMDDPVRVLAPKLPGIDAEAWRRQIDDFHQRQIGANADECRTDGLLLDHVNAVAQFRGSVLVMHCADDEVHDVEMARRMHAAAAGGRSSKARLSVFEAGGHNYIHPMNWKAIAHELAVLLADDADDCFKDGSFWRGSAVDSMERFCAEPSRLGGGGRCILC